MARPIKQGLDYCTLDTDIFGDRKTRRLLKTFGPKGFTIFIALLCEIYKDKGYYIQWDDELAFDVSDTIPGTTEQLVKEVVSFCVECGLFDRPVFTVRAILTSHGIQNRYRKAKDGGKLVFDPEIWVIDRKTPVNSGKPLVNGSESTQRKEKERKEKETKGADEDFSELPTEESNPPPGGAAPPSRYLVPAMAEVWNRCKQDYPYDPPRDFEPLQELAKFIAKLLRIPYDPESSEAVDSILAAWEQIAKFIAGEGFFKSYSLQQVNRHIQSIIQRMKNGTGKKQSVADSVNTIDTAIAHILGDIDAAASGG